MPPPRFDRLAWPALALFVGLLAIYLAWFAGWRLNTTPSLPTGFYKLEDRPALIGDVVSFCSPIPMPFMPPGPCPGGVASLLKQVVAVGGDVVDVTPARVMINGIPLPRSTSLQQSQAFPSLSIPHSYGRFDLRPGEVWVFGSGDPERSFDSRYFGPVSAESILGVSNVK